MTKPKTKKKTGTDIESNGFIARLADTGSLVNLAGNYDYLSTGYYLSQDYENSGQEIRPMCKEMLDAYIQPLFLEKARLSGIPVPEYYLSNGYFEPPVIVDPINPFTLKGRVVWKSRKVKSIAKSLTRNFTYAICCQEIPEGSRITHFRSVLGWTVTPVFRGLSKNVWEIFNIPLAKIRVICTPNGRCLLSDISPLFPEDLSARELNHIKEQVRWDN